MIQRIQTIFLLLAAILMAVTVFSPLVILEGGNRFVSLYPYGMVEAGNTTYMTWGVITFACLAILLPVINIFLYKKRKIQVKVCSFTIFIIVVFYITLYAYLYFLMAKNGLSLQGMQYGIILPAIALIFVVLASVNIKKDERLIQSLNRIR